MPNSPKTIASPSVYYVSTQGFFGDTEFQGVLGISVNGTSHEIVVCNHMFVSASAASETKLQLVGKVFPFAIDCSRGCNFTLPDLISFVFDARLTFAAPDGLPQTVRLWGPNNALMIAEAQMWLLKAQQVPVPVPAYPDWTSMGFDDDENHSEALVTTVPQTLHQMNCTFPPPLVPPTRSSSSTTTTRHASVSSTKTASSVASTTPSLGTTITFTRSSSTTASTLPSTTSATNSSTASPTLPSTLSSTFSSTSSVTAPLTKSSTTSATISSTIPSTLPSTISSRIPSTTSSTIPSTISSTTSPTLPSTFLSTKKASTLPLTISSRISSTSSVTSPSTLSSTISSTIPSTVTSTKMTSTLPSTFSSTTLSTTLAINSSTTSVTPPSTLSSTISSTATVTAPLTKSSPSSATISSTIPSTLPSTTSSTLPPSTASPTISSTTSATNSSTTSPILPSTITSTEKASTLPSSFSSTTSATISSTIPSIPSSTVSSPTSVTHPSTSPSLPSSPSTKSTTTAPATSTTVCASCGSTNASTESSSTATAHGTASTPTSESTFSSTSTHENRSTTFGTTEVSSTSTATMTESTATSTEPQSSSLGDVSTTETSTLTSIASSTSEIDTPATTFETTSSAITTQIAETSSTDSGGNTEMTKTTIGQPTSLGTSTSSGKGSTMANTSPSAANTAISSTTTQTSSTTSTGSSVTSVSSSSPSASTTTSTIETSTTPQTPVSWPTEPTAMPVPAGELDCRKPLNALETLFCNETDEGKPKPGCMAGVLGQVTQLLSNGTIDRERVESVAKIVQVVGRVANITQNDFRSVAGLLDAVLEAPMEVFVSSEGTKARGRAKRELNPEHTPATVILQAISDTLRNSPVNVTYLNGTNLALVGRAFDCAQSADVGGLSDQGTRFREGVDPEADASIQLQHATLCRANASRVFLHAFRSSKLFAGAAGVPTGLVAHAFATTSEQAETGGRSCAAGLFPTDGRVLSAVVEDAHGRPLHNVSGDAVLVSLRFARRHIGVPLHGSLKLSWWEGVRWSGRSCAVHTDHLAYVAHCTHLTDFTLLVDGMAKDPILCSDGLIIVNYFIIISSLVALAILNGVYIAIMFPLTSSSSVGKRISGVVPATAKDALSTTHSVLLFFFFFVFVIFSDESRTTGEGGCMVVAGLNYWLLTSCIMFSLFMSWKVLKVFAWTTTMENVLGVLTSAKIVYPVSIGVPSAFVIGFGAATKLDFFYRNDSFCWIRPDFIGIAVVVPLSILVVNALVCTFMMSLRLFPRWRLARLLRETSTTINRPSKRDTRERVVVLVLWQFTLGVPWLLQYLTLFSPGVTAWHFLFSIVLGSQGVVLFGSFCYRCVRSARTARGLYAVRTEQEKQHRSPRINGHRRKQTQNLATNST